MRQAIPFVTGAVSERRTDVKHGICKPCGRRRILWLPAALCDRCLLKAAAALEVKETAE